MTNTTFLEDETLPDWYYDFEVDFGENCPECGSLASEPHNEKCEIVTFFDMLEIGYQSEADSTKKKPHQRRGHWRRTKVGKGRTETKFVFIKPMLINSHRFVGVLTNVGTAI